MNKQIQNITPNHVHLIMAFTGRKPGYYFQTKDKTQFEHNQDAIYNDQCIEIHCIDYVNGTPCRTKETDLDHSVRDKNFTYLNIVLKFDIKHQILKVLVLFGTPLLSAKMPSHCS